MNVFLYITINALLFSSWYIFLFHKKDVLSFSDRLVGFFVLGLAQIIGTEMLLGVLFKNLFPVPLFVLNAVISLTVLITALRNGRSKGIIKEIKHKKDRFAGILKGDWILLCICGLMLILVCRILVIGYLFPSYSWDGLWYHMPIVGKIMQSGTIQSTPAASFENIAQFAGVFPKNIELFFIWNMIFLKNSVIVNLSQLPFTIVAVINLYSMAVKLKIKEKYAVYSSFLFFFTPIIILQSTINYVDIATSVLFLIAVNFLIWESPEHDRGSGSKINVLTEHKTPFLLSGVAAGIMLGSKGSGPLLITVLSAAVFIKVIIQRINMNKKISSNRGFIDTLKPFMTRFMAPTFLLGGYWYVANWILYGNPVYPIEVTLFNVPIFKGLYKEVIDRAFEIVHINEIPLPVRLFNIWLEKVEYYMHDARLSGFGPLWFILYLPGIAFSIVHVVIMKKYNFLYVNMILIVSFLLYPSNWNTRYVVFIVALGTLSYGYLLNLFYKRDSMIRGMALILAGYTFLTVNSPCMMPEKIKEFYFLPAKERTLSRLKPFNIDSYVRDNYGYWIWIDNNMRPHCTLAHSFVSSVLDPFQPFFEAPLWSLEYSNKVVHIQSDSYKEWLQELIDNNVTHVLYKKASLEDQWIEKERNRYYSLRWLGSMREKFKIVYADEKYKIAGFLTKGQ